MCDCHRHYTDGRHKSSCSQTAEVDMDLAARQATRATRTSTSDSAHGADGSMFGQCH